MFKTYSSLMTSLFFVSLVFLHKKDKSLKVLGLRKVMDVLWQLIRELRMGHVFEGWKEGILDFPPTYKYEFNSDRYIGEVPKEGEKRRSPAW